MIAMDSPTNNENPNGSHFSDYTMVYFEFVATGSGKRSEVCEIGAHFGESSFSRYVCPLRGLSTNAAKLTKKDGNLYLEGERVETVSKMDAWKDFLKFLQSANNSVVLVIHDGQYNVLFRELSGLSLMEEFRKVCAGVIDTLPLCQHIFPARREIGKNYKLKLLVQDKLGEENSSGHHSAAVDAVNLEKLMKHAKVEPEVFQKHFISLSKLECWYEKIPFGRKKARKVKVNRKESSAITLDVSKQAKKKTAKESLLYSENRDENHQFSNHTLVYFDMETTGTGRNSEVCQIVAHFMEKSFSRYVCPEGTMMKTVTELTGLSKKDGILYLGGERVETVSKMDAWKDFLKFLESANNDVVLVMHDRHNHCFLLFRDLSELSLMEEFREVCAGVIVTLPRSKNIFSANKKTGKNYILKELVQDILGKEISVGSHSAIADAINLEKLRKHANVQPEIFQQHFFSLSVLEYWYQINRQTILLRKKFPLMSLGLPKEMAKAGITYNDLARSYVECGGDGIASFLSHRLKITDPKTIREKIIEIIPVLEQQFTGPDLQGGRQQSTDIYVAPHLRKEVAADKMTTEDSPENPQGSDHFSEHTLVYFDLEATGYERNAEVCQIGACFAEESFSRYICPIGTFTNKVARATRLSKKDGILYLGRETVESVSKMDAWKDFLKFLQSANNSVVLVIYYRHNDCFLLFRDLSELSLMEEFRKVCAGVVDAFPLCQNIFPGREDTGKNYRLKELLQDILGEEISAGSHSAIANAINLEKLMKHAKVQLEIFQQRFISLFNLEYQHRTDKRRNSREVGLLRRKFPSLKIFKAVKMAECGITYNDLERNYVEGGEDGIASFLSGRMKNICPKAFRNLAMEISQIFSSELDLY